MNKTLTDKQESFVAEYLIDLNATQAYMRSKYSCKSEKTAGAEGFKLLKKPEIQKAISEGKEKRLERTKVDADYVLKSLVEIDEMDVIDILDNTGNMLPIRDWPKAWRRTISGLDIQEIMSGDVETVLRKIKWPDKVKNLELLGKHIDVQAFREQRLLDATVSLADTMNDIAKRNAEERVSPLPKDNINFPKDQ